MLINAQRPEEVRVAIMSGQTLEGYQLAVAEAGLARGNIYRGQVVNIHQALNAAFVDFGAERNGMLAGHDVVPQAYHRQPGSQKAGSAIENLVERGRSILVQVTKDPAGTKGAALTTNVSLAGRYLVLLPFDDTRGISRKVEDEDTRAAMREQADKLAIPEGFGFILRTNALAQTKATLGRDLAGLLRLWKRVRAEFARGKGPRLLYSDQDIVVQALRDYLDTTIEEVLVDNDEVFTRAEAYLRASMPRGKTRLARYTERMPLFARFGVEPQIDRIHARTVELAGGGSVVIDATEALTAIDVNSGKTPRSGSPEESILAVNLEAAREVARQLRLRDIGGLVVVDFIDMRSHAHDRAVEKALREAVKADKARMTIGRISSNGLLEINRQRIKPALQLRTHRRCPTCDGTGHIPSPEFVGGTLLRRIEARAAGGRLGGVRVALHPELADAIQNRRRAELAALEGEFDMRIEIIASTSLHRSDEQVVWLDREVGEAERSGLVVTAADAVAGTTPAAEEGQASTSSDKHRRRRRGGRRRKKTTVEAASPGSEPPAPAATPDPSANGEEKPKKRRRRHRRRTTTTPADSQG
jgi:ribonuclease E